MKKIAFGLFVSSSLIFSGNAFATTVTDIFGAADPDGIAVYLSDFPAAVEIDVYMNGDPDSTILWGSLGANNGNEDVKFESTEVINGANGFASIKYAKDGADKEFANLSISTPGLQFGDIILSTQGATQFLLSIFNGLTLIDKYSFTEVDNGNTDFMVLATNPLSITSILLEATGGIGNQFFEVKQIQLSDVRPIGSVVAPVPVPAALPLLAAGLGMLGWIGRSRSKKASIGT